MKRRPPIAIAGAGLGGLCLAQALLRSGCDVHVYERDATPHARRQGYRITANDQGAAALEYCLPPELFEAVRATASSPRGTGYFRFTNEHLGEIFRLTFKDDSAPPERRLRLGQIDRATLRTILLSGLEGRVHFGKAAAGFETGDGGATLRFADGTFTWAALVVGADGVHSRIREQLLPDCPVIDTGTFGIYGKTPVAVCGRPLVPHGLKDSGVLAIGPPGRFFFFTTMTFANPPADVFARWVPDQQPPLADDYVMWAVGFPKAVLPAQPWALAPAAWHRMAIEIARDFHPVLRRLVEEAHVDHTILTSLAAAKRPTRWPTSRVTLLGDAVHVMPPTGALGGNTALRDAALLAQRLQQARDGDLLEAVTKYQEEMISYAFKEVDSSVAMLRRTCMMHPLARFAMLRTVPWLRSLAGQSLVPSSPMAA